MGATFENLYLRTRQSDTLMNALKDCFALYDRLEEPYPFKIG